MLTGHRGKSPRRKKAKQIIKPFTGAKPPISILSKKKICPCCYDFHLHSILSICAQLCAIFLLEWSFLTIMLEPQVIVTLGQIMKERMAKDVILLEDLRNELSDFKRGVRQIHPYSSNSISIVGTDGGNNNLQFDPFVVHVIRVVDSNNVEYYMDVITPTTPIEELDNKIKERNDPLKKMMDYLGVVSLTQLSPMIKKIQPGKPVSPSWVQVYRELVEWATLFSLVKDREFASDTLIVFDGLLRSKVFSGTLFNKLKAGIEETIKEKEKRTRCKLYVVGLAKHSKVLDRYRLIMSIDKVMKTPYPCFAKVPKEMEEKAYVWSEYARDDSFDSKITEINKFVAGKMFLVKFGDKLDDPIWPVDILMSQVDEADRILGNLLNDAIYGFPIPWYPMSLQKAHDNSALVDFDMTVIQDTIFDSIRLALGDKADRLNAFLLTDGDVATRRYGKG